MATRTRDVLRRFGADPDAVSVDDAAARVSASVVRERIVSALDRLLRQEKSTGVRALLRRVDADPYRDAVRDAILAGNRGEVDGTGGPTGRIRATARVSSPFWARARRSRWSGGGNCYRRR